MVKFSMEFCLVLGHGIPSKHFHRILRSSTETKFRGILSGIGAWNSMEFYENIIYGILWSSTKAQLHGILSGFGTSKSMKKYPWNSIENYMWSLRNLGLPLYKSFYNLKV